ncbi:MAG: hypothetical protein RL411_830 [Bacteroidota bacterium]|jgi:hypothetical protein
MMFSTQMPQTLDKFGFRLLKTCQPNKDGASRVLNLLSISYV